MLIRTGKYPDVLKDRPDDSKIRVTKKDDVLIITGKNEDLKVVSTELILLDDGTFYQAVVPPEVGVEPRKRIVGLIAYETIFNPDVVIPQCLSDERLDGCINVAHVVEKCLPANWRLTAEQQADMPAYIANSIDRWEYINSNGEGNEEEPERPAIHPADV